MSWRDSASGSSDWHGGGGTAGNSGTRGAGTGGNSTGGSNSGTNFSRTGGLGGGLSTGNTIFGNTAFGIPGGLAQGHATAKLGAGAGMGPTTNTYSNFRKPDGTPMFSGSVQGMGIRAPNANVAAAALRALQEQAQAAAQRVGGLLSDEEVTSGPLDPAIGPVVVEPTTAVPPLVNVPYLGGVFNGTLDLGNRIVGGPMNFSRSRYGAYANSLYDNPTLGTPGLGSGLNRYPDAAVRNGATYVNVLGGGGMPGLGTVPTAGRWSEEARDTYGGYGRTSDGYSHSFTGIRN